MPMQKNGFTLIELMVSLAMISIVMAAIVSAYTGQVKAKNTQEILTDMHQTARAAIEIMANEIRMAGLDPTEEASASITTANTGELIFSLDREDNAGTNESDGDCCDSNEQIRYCLTNDATDANGFNGVNDVIAEGVECHLGRETGPGMIGALGCTGGTNGLQPLVRNIDVLNFVYLTDDNNGDGDPDVLPTPVAANKLDDIRAIEVTIVVRAGTVSRGFVYGYTDTNDYYNRQDLVNPILPAQNDHFRRLQLSTTIACRNLRP